jgi:hypothetical protein
MEWSFSLVTPIVLNYTWCSDWRTPNTVFTKCHHSGKDAKKGRPGLKRIWGHSSWFPVTDCTLEIFWDRGTILAFISALSYLCVGFHHAKLGKQARWQTLGIFNTHWLSPFQHQALAPKIALQFDLSSSHNPLPTSYASGFPTKNFCLWSVTWQYLDTLGLSFQESLIWWLRGRDAVNYPTMYRPVTPEIMAAPNVCSVKEKKPIVSSKDSSSKLLQCFQTPDSCIQTNHD